MAHDSKRTPAISAALDACRPARLDPNQTDWRQPETAALAEQIAAEPRLAELRERIGALDSAIAATIVEGPLPAGLSDRLMAALRAAAPAEGAAGGVASCEEIAEPTLPLATERCLDRLPLAARRRRRVIGVVAALAAAACLAAIWASRSPQPLSYEQVIAEANLYDAAAPANEWKSLSKSQPDKWYSVSPAISATRVGWRKVNAFFKRSGVAYRLVSGTGAKAVLYVVPLARVGGPSLEVAGKLPPNRPDMTGGKATAAWTDGTRLWVLVVQGGQREYRSFRPTGMA